ncbi:MAG: HAD family hydrolase [Erysipelotrichaceae bacterium]|nr:HAD family hydrolase [Erysipelotrichaceae bacterium]
MIKAILFDYDGTLSNRIESGYKKYQADCREIFPDLDPNGIELEAIIQRCMTWDEYGTINKRHVYTQLKEAYNLDIDVEKWVENWYNTFHLYQVLQRDCKEILKKLSQHYKLGCVTNGNSYTQHIKLDYTNLKECFDVVFVSGDYGIHKPDKKLFLMAADELGIKPEEIAFVGDTFATDILGAHRAGMHPIWFFNDPLRYSDTQVTRIYSFYELLETFGIE